MPWVCNTLLFTVLLVLLNQCSSELKPLKPSNRLFPKLHATTYLKQDRESHLVKSSLSYYGGSVENRARSKTPPSPTELLIAKVNEIHPATRSHFLLAIFCSVVHMIGLPAPDLFSLDASRPLQLWRPLTSCAYLGAPSLSMVNNLYFLVKYGQTLEAERGTATQIWFLLVQTAVLSALGLLLGFPFQARALISAAVFAACNINPSQNMQFQFGLKIQTWQLPFLLMALDCLSHQSLSAAWPHAMGIFSGHIFHFFQEVWPSMSGRRYLATPMWLKRIFKGPAGALHGGTSEGTDFRGHVKDYRHTAMRPVKKSAPGNTLDRMLSNSKKRLFPIRKKRKMSAGVTLGSTTS